MKDGAIPLIEGVRRAGVIDHYVLLGEGNMRRWDWEKMSSKLQGDTLALWRFLFLGEKVPKSDLVNILGSKALGFLTRHKLCHSENGELSMGTACLLSFRDHLFFADIGSAKRTLFSDETRALISLLPKLKKGRCLSLYPTVGAELLPLVSQPNVEVAFLKGERNRPLLEANLEMGTVGKKHEFITKAEALKSSFDLILASPPSCVSVPGIPLPNYVSGGPDGCRWVKECLGIAEKSLAPRGQMAMVFMFFSDGESPGMESQIRSVLKPYKLDYRLLITSKMLLEPGVPIFNQLVALSGHFNKNKNENPEEVVAKVLAYLKAEKYGAVYLVKALVSKPEGDVRREEITNYSDDYYGTWTF